MISRWTRVMTAAAFLALSPGKSSAGDMKVLGSPGHGGSLGTLDGWAAFGILEHPDLVWVSKNASSGKAATLVESLSHAPKLIPLMLSPSPAITENYFDLQDDFENAAQSACEQLASKKILSLKAAPLFPDLGGFSIEESAITVIKTTASPSVGHLSLESAPVRCKDPKGQRLKFLLNRSTVMLAYAAAAEGVNRIKPAIPEKNRQALLQLALFKQTLRVFKAREPWFQKNAPGLRKTLDQGQLAMTRRAEKHEKRYRRDFPSNKDIELLLNNDAVDASDWAKLGLK